MLAGLHMNAEAVPPQHSVETPHLTHVLRVSAEPANNLQYDSMLHLLSGPLKVGKGPGEDKVIAMHHYPDIPFNMVKNTQGLAAPDLKLNDLMNSK